MFSLSLAGKEDPESGNMEPLTTDRAQRKGEAKVPGTFPKVLHSCRSSELISQRVFNGAKYHQRNKLCSQGYIHQLFPCNDNRGHESPRNSVLSRNGEVGIGEVAFGFVYSSNFFS